VVAGTGGAEHEAAERLAIVDVTEPAERIDEADAIDAYALVLGGAKHYQPHKVVCQGDHQQLFVNACDGLRAEHIQMQSRREPLDELIAVPQPPRPGRARQSFGALQLGERRAGRQMHVSRVKVHDQALSHGNTACEEVPHLIVGSLRCAIQPAETIDVRNRCGNGRVDEKTQAAGLGLVR
jgi:hypothetical protein